MNYMRAFWLVIALALCIGIEPQFAGAQTPDTAASDEQGKQALQPVKPCSPTTVSANDTLEDAPLSIPPATGKDQTLVVRVVVQQPYIDNVATRVTYDGWDHVFGIEWPAGKTTMSLRIPESSVTKERVFSDILDCTAKGVSVPERFTPLTAPRLFPFLLAVRAKWSENFDEALAASTKMAAVALIVTMRTPAAPTAAPAAAAATTTRGRLGTTAKPLPPATATRTGKPTPAAKASATPSGSKALAEASGAQSKLLPEARVGHSTPWAEMALKQRRAFQHSYSRHAKELGLPNWNQKNAASLQKKFNDIVGYIRNNGQLTTGLRKPFNGSSVEVNYWEATLHGKRYYYYETLDGQFISAGLAR